MNPRYLWLTAGVVIVVLTGIVAAPNLQEIYGAQKDFVVGGMLSLAGFSLGKAVDRSREARERWLQVNKVYESINDIEANAKFASEALWKITDPSAASVLVDCRKRMAESIRLVALLDNTLSPADQVWTFVPAQRAILEKLSRDIDAAVDRLYSSRMELLSRLDVQRDDAEWALFFVLVDDLLKAQGRLHVIGTKHTDLPVESQLYVIQSYLRAAQRRSAEFAEVLEAKSIPQPNTFGVMCRDVSDALAEVGTMAAGVGRPARTGVMLQ
jgi:hypothetical protein